MILKAFVLTPGATWFFQRYRWIIFAVERINLFPLDTVAISVSNTYPLVSRFIRLIAAFERLGPDVWRYWIRALKKGNLEKRINFLDFPLLYLIDVTVAGTSMHSLLYGLMPQDWSSKFLRMTLQNYRSRRIPAKDNYMIATPEKSAYHRNLSPKSFLNRFPGWFRALSSRMRVRKLAVSKISGFMWTRQQVD